MDSIRGIPTKTLREADLAFVKRDDGLWDCVKNRFGEHHTGLTKEATDAMVLNLRGEGTVVRG